MKPKILVVILALAGLGGLAAYAYKTQRLPGVTGFEIGGAKGNEKAGEKAADKGGDKAGDKGAAKAAGGPGGAGGGRPAGPAFVEVSKVAVAALREEAVAAGTLRANEIVTLRSEVAGRVVAVGFTGGARVARNAVL
ncbi:MAG: hypothetical protein ACK49H_07470, partial [Burkholderiales bacterium]